MPAEPKRIALIELAMQLEEYNKTEPYTIALLLGARTGALYRSPIFNSTIENFSKRNVARPTMSDYERFNDDFTILQDNKEDFGGSYIKEVLYEALKNAPVSTADICLAQLVQQKIFRFILSTNLGSTLEDAQRMTDKRKSKLDFSVFTKRHPIITIASHEKLNICKLIKIPEDEDAFVDDLSYLEKQADNGKFVKEVLSKSGIKHLLVVGLDKLWDAFLLPQLPATVETIWFVNEEEDVIKDFYERYKHIESFSYITGIAGSYERFFKSLHLEVNNGEPPDLYELADTLSQRILNMQSELDRMKKDHDQLANQLKNLPNDVSQIRKLLDEWLTRTRKS